MAHYPLPRDTRLAFSVGQAGCYNLGLLFQRYVPFGQDWALEAKLKLEAFKTIVEAAERARKDAGFQRTIASFHQRWLDCVLAAGALDDCIFDASPDWRFVIGLGQDSALETGFTFHRVYGFPYIPGSALKGLTQTYALWLVAEHFGVPAVLPGEKVGGDTAIQTLEKALLATDEKERNELLGKLRAKLPISSRLNTLSNDQVIEEMKKHEAAENYCAVFGTQNARGRVIFFDAIPVTPPKLGVDVMNPHYGPYYQGKGNDTPPADYLSPVPVYFLAVESGSRFAFAVGAGGHEHAEDASLALLACQWLKEALNILGAGGKTSAGYGYFQLPSIVSAQRPQAPSTGAATSTPKTPKEVTTAAEVAKTSEELSVPETWRSGVVREYNPQLGRGRLVDEANGEEYHFERSAILTRGWSPGRNHKVRYVAGKREGKPVAIKLERL